MVILILNYHKKSYLESTGGPFDKSYVDFILGQPKFAPEIAA